jgi:hypothetical protein
LTLESIYGHYIVCFIVGTRNVEARRKEEVVVVVKENKELKKEEKLTYRKIIRATSLSYLLTYYPLPYYYKLPSSPLTY